VPPAVRAGRLEQSAQGRRLLEVSRLSPLEFVEQEFRHPAIQAGLLFFNGLREVDPRASDSVITFPRCWRAVEKRRCAEEVRRVLPVLW
jgi:hypothetical protein